MSATATTGAGSRTSKTVVRRSRSHIHWQGHKVGKQHHGPMKEAPGDEEDQNAYPCADSCNGPSGTSAKMACKLVLATSMHCGLSENWHWHEQQCGINSHSNEKKMQGKGPWCKKVASRSGASCVIKHREERGLRGKGATYERADAYAEANSCTP